MASDNQEKMFSSLRTCWNEAQSLNSKKNYSLVVCVGDKEPVAELYAENLWKRNVNKHQCIGTFFKKTFFLLRSLCPIIGFIRGVSLVPFCTLRIIDQFISNLQGSMKHRYFDRWNRFKWTVGELAWTAFQTSAPKQEVCDFWSNAGFLNVR